MQDICSWLLEVRYNKREWDTSTWNYRIRFDSDSLSTGYAEVHIRQIPKYQIAYFLTTDELFQRSMK